MNARRTTFLLSGLFFVLLAGCTPGSRSRGNAFTGDSMSESVRIYVTNRNFMDATLWAVTAGTRKKLGIVTGKREAVYTIPWRFSDDLRIEIDMLAGKRCTTERLPVDPGDDIELIIDVDMNGSPVCSRGGEDGHP